MGKVVNEIRQAYRDLKRTPRYTQETPLDQHQRMALDAVIGDPTIAHLLPQVEIVIRSSAVYLAVDGGRVALGIDLLQDAALARIHLRHGLEHVAWLRSAKDESAAAAAALLALHTVYAYWRQMPFDDRQRVLQRSSSRLREVFASLEQAHGERVSPRTLAERLIGAWPMVVTLDRRLSSIPADFEAIARRVADALTLAQPVERVLTFGGDARLLLEADSRLNKYGCSPLPRPWAVTFSTCTATSISDLAFQAAERQRQALFSAAAAGRLEAGFAEAMKGIRNELTETLQLGEVPGVRVILSPSGTDAELIAVHCAFNTSKGPLLNILIAPREIGSGSRHAAAGRHFDHTTPLGGAVQPGCAIDGLDCERVRVQELELRNDAGHVLPDDEVATHLQSMVEAGIERGESVLIHLLDSSKTGLGAPKMDLVVDLRARYVDKVSIIVDAAQMRVSRRNLHRYLRNECYVIVTGSKFFTGPPFSGALLIPPAAARRVERAEPFAAGLAHYCGRYEIPEEWRHLADHLSTGLNFGLILRWRAALWEMRAFFAVDRHTRRQWYARFAERIRRKIQSCEHVELVEAPPYQRGDIHDDSAWDAVPTIFTFLIKRGNRLLSYDEAASAYQWLNTDISECLPESATAHRSNAAVCCHVGQPVRLRMVNGQWAGALRIAPGARLASRVCFDSSIGASTEERLTQQIEAAGMVFDKLAVICRYWDDIAARVSHRSARALRGQAAAS